MATENCTLVATENCTLCPRERWRGQLFSPVGSSPRVRGTARLRGFAAPDHRFIPACAGNGLVSGSSPSSESVHPRVCGERLPVKNGMCFHLGSSPRVRGNRDATAPQRPCSRSIPAGAGEPAGSVVHTSHIRVYPRGCGGTVVPFPPAGRSWGLSPRVRGNPRSTRSAPSSRGSIPAGAGEPRRPLAWPGVGRVYPRGCGGTLDTARQPPAHLRSIPAGAGEPRVPIARSREFGVYPRGCGGTSPRAQRRR